jgi:hypothetical protein
MSKKYLSNFSCGAASAYATYLAIQKYRSDNVHIIYMPVANEHSDNKRFLKDCEKLFGKEVEQLRSRQYPSMDIYDVFYRRDTRSGKPQLENKPFYKTPKGAPCTSMLKRAVREKFQKDTTEYEEHIKNQIFGFTVEEKHRHDRLQETIGVLGCNSKINVISPLIENNITKDDCYQWLNIVGIEIPMMYRLGYNNNNCAGCVKGGMGYWNKIRKDFPEVFAKMSKIEEESNYTLFDVPLSKLDPKAGRHNEPMLDCDLFCQLQKQGHEKFYCEG